MGEKTDLRITPVTVQAQSASKLRDAIVDGLLKPGEKLLEAELCRQWMLAGHRCARLCGNSKPNAW